MQEPDSSSPFVRHDRLARGADRHEAGGLDDEFLPEAAADNVEVAEDDSLAAFGSESAREIPPEPPRKAAAAAKPAVRPTPAPAPMPRPAFAIRPIWLVAAAIGGAIAGIGYASYLRPAPPAAPRAPSVTESARVPDAASVPAAPTPPKSAPPAPAPPAPAPPVRAADPPRSNVPAASATPPRPAPRASGQEPQSIASETLAPSAIAALPNVPAAQPLAPPVPPAEPREESENARDQRLIRSLLDAYRSAYERLDPLAVAALWPGVDSRAITRAFSTLSAQRMTFDRCEITITGSVAVARCDGTLAYSRSVGEGDSQSRSMAWAFALERGSGQWRISGVNSR